MTNNISHQIVVHVCVLQLSYICICTVSHLHQKSEAQLELALKEIKSLKELVSSQEKRISKLEEHIANMSA